MNYPNNLFSPCEYKEIATVIVSLSIVPAALDKQ